MIPTFACPAVITPGQLGPINRQLKFLMYSFTLIISLIGIPSVMQTISPIPPSAASIIASAANAGGTKMMETFAPVFETASLMVLKTGLSKCNDPPLPGVTPPTTLVPNSIIWPAWNVPSLPVNPCTITFELLFTRTPIFVIFKNLNSKVSNDF